MLKWKVTDTAGKAEVSPNTVVRLEAGNGTNSATAKAIRAAYEAAGIEFIPENGGGAGVRMAKPPAQPK